MDNQTPNQTPPTTNPIENPVPQAGTPPSPRSFLSKKTIFATFFVLIIFTLVFVIPFPSWYLGGTACMPCQDKNNCPPCPSQQWVFQKPIFWSVILPLLKGTPTNRTVKVNTSQSIPTPTPDPTASWKTYTNQKYNFLIRYPNDYKISEGISQYDDTFTLGITNQQTQRERGVDSDKMMISVIPGSKNFQRNDFYYGGYEWTKTAIEMLSNAPNGTSKDHKYDTLTKISEITLSGFTGVKYKATPIQRFPIEGFSSINAALMRKDKTFLVSGYTGNDTLVFTKPYSDIFDQILSTFKFINVSPTPTCRPRPACLDATPRCLVPEASDMCPKAVACTQEAKICPDGSSVGRQGPNCEFAPCP